jgi:hypothetical protein
VTCQSETCLSCSIAIAFIPGQPLPSSPSACFVCCLQYPASFLGQMPGYPVTVACGFFTADQQGDLQVCVLIAPMHSSH